MPLRKSMFMLVLLVGVASITIMLLSSNRVQHINPTNNALKVTVSILPQQYFIERLGGVHVEVNVMVLPGESPATYEPRPDQISALAEATAYFRIGVPFEDAWMERIVSVNREMMIVDTTQGIERVPLRADGRNPDPHIWLSPLLVKVQAQTMCDALVKLDPLHAGDYRSNLEVLQADIDALDADIRSKLDDLQTRTFVVFHPAWGYFAREYNLEMIPVEIDGHEPSAAELAGLISLARQEGIRFVFAQPQFEVTEVEIIAGEIGGQVLLIDALSPDWLNNLRSVANTFSEVMGENAG